MSCEEVNQVMGDASKTLDKAQQIMKCHDRILALITQNRNILPDYFLMEVKRVIMENNLEPSSDAKH